ncbi:restriction endonuclease subunit S [Escherichia coli]|uniref:restriction endonuclease subunit S n=1 Tax=Escherichia coli TaxID=562 RepID=UPI000BE4F91E|nr:restriction endonuclease subunit S [Escherichia coli]EEZ5316471.1 restriction endonuclease subunit S [Escherichia coli]EFM4245417.1 restriction endonuclease subunit S [Escherichia coli]EFN8289868.1 restriction endonuclease subunit S [Escherichia coli]EFO3244099.1 restriction endonuclease subunit S [Escherichia coli]EFO3481496.1 restriction endonuclease subunit S [Escherichia coli]
MVPKGWEKNSLDSLFEFKNGLNTEKEQYGNGYKFVNVMDVFRNDILTESKIIGRVQVTDKQLEGYQLKYGDVLFNRTSETFDEIAIAAIYLDNAIATFGGFVIRARPKGNQIDPAYSVFLFQSKSYRSQVVKLGQGAIRANIGQKDLARVCILVPPLAEQKKIAQILSTWDKAISVTEKLLANSQQQKKALMQQLLTGKKRLLDENGTRFSETWKLYALSKLFQRVTTKNNGKSNNVVTISGQHGLIKQEDFFKKTVASDTLDGYFLLKKGQFAYNKSYSNGYPMGAIKRLNRYPEGVVTTLYICFELTTPKKSCGDYWEHYFESGLLNNSLSQIAHEGGRAHGLLNVKPSDFFSLKVAVPGFEEQQKIASVLSAADTEISTLEKKLACLKDEKKALMQQLLTGKRRVKVDEAVAV